MKGDVVLIKGDGVGTEIVNQAIKSLKSIEQELNLLQKVLLSIAF